MTACATHPEVEAVGACARCGRFYCAADERALDGQKYCLECAARPDLDWQGAWAVRQRGRRTPLIWALLPFGFSLFVVGQNRALNGDEPALGWSLTANGVTALLLFARRRRARMGLVLTAAVTSTLLFATPSREPLHLEFVRSLPTLAIALWTRNEVLAVLLLGFAWRCATDPGTLLFLEQEVPRAALTKHIERNPLAAAASLAALLALLVPWLAPVGALLAAAALYRSWASDDPATRRRGRAVVALVVSMLLSLGWGSIFLGMALRRLAT